MSVLCLASAALDLNDVSDLGNVDKLVDESLAVHLGEDASLVVIPEQDVFYNCYVRVSSLKEYF